MRSAHGVVLRELNLVSFCSPELALAEAQILTIIFAAFIVLIITAWETDRERIFREAVVCHSVQYLLCCTAFL